MKLGMVGLGKMGGNMAERLRRGGHEVVGYDPSAPTRRRRRRSPALVDARSATAAAGGVGRWCRPATPPSRRSTELAGAARPRRPRDRRRQLQLHATRSAAARRWPASGIGFVDCGTSGGVWGLDNGYCLMVGGDRRATSPLAQPVFDALRPARAASPTSGPVGAGHFTKMVHNGIEYGLMQAYAEGYEHPRRRASSASTSLAGLGVVAARVSVVRSWLLDLLVDGARATNPSLDGIAPVAADSGEGRWTVDRGGPPRRAGPGHLRRAVRPLRVPAGRVDGHEGGRRPPQPVRRPRRRASSDAAEASRAPTPGDPDEPEP